MLRRLLFTLALAIPMSACVVSDENPDESSTSNLVCIPDATVYDQCVRDVQTWCGENPLACTPQRFSCKLDECAHVHLCEQMPESCGVS